MAGTESKEAERIDQYKALEMDQRLVMNLRDLGHMLRFLYEGKGNPKRILIILHETGTTTEEALTERMGLLPDLAEEAIHKLEESGLIRRNVDPGDGQTVNIQLTEIGKIQALQTAQQRKARHREMFSCFSEEERTLLLELLEKLNVYWDHRYQKDNRDDNYNHSAKQEYKEDYIYSDKKLMEET